MIFFNKATRASVIFPTYGFAPFSLLALESVCRQSVKNIEIFVVCDGTPQEMVKEFKKAALKDKRIRVFEFPKSERTGEPYRDLLIKTKARGRNIFYCSHDDLWLPDHIREMEKVLREKVFAHSIHAVVNELQEEFDEKNIFKLIYFADISDAATRNAMLDETALKNNFGLTFAAHTRKSYLELKQGWTTTPKGIFTDLYMWRKYLKDFGNESGTCKKITALNFPAPLRSTWNPQKRADELKFYFDKIQEPGFIDRIRKIAEHFEPALKPVNSPKVAKKAIKLTAFIPKNKMEWHHFKTIFLLRKSKLFDDKYYLDHNPDVKEAGISPIVHYLLAGGTEGRNPSPHFNSIFYLEQNPDVKNAGMNPLVHYLKFGKKEGRLSCPDMPHQEKQNKLPQGQSPSVSKKEYNYVPILSDDLQDFVLPLNSLSSLQIDITSACNLACKQCFRYIKGHKSGNFPPLLWEKRIVPLLPKIKNIYLVGIGEPLLSKDFIHYVADSKKHGVTVHTTSNLQLLDEAMADQIVANGIDVLSFSCDGAKDETYAKIRINGTLDNLKRSLDMINQAKIRHHSLLPVLILNFGANMQNIREFPEVVQFAYDNGVKQIIAFHNVAYVYEQREDSLFHKQELSDEYFIRAKSLADKYGIETKMTALFSDPFKKDPAALMCGFPFRFLYIHHDGRVGPCCMDFPDRYNLGSINDQTIEEIWNGEPMLQLRRSVNMNPSETCKFCADYTKMDISDPRFLFRFEGSSDYIKSLRPSRQD